MESITSLLDYQRFADIQIFDLRFDQSSQKPQGYLELSFSDAGAALATRTSVIEVFLMSQGRRACCRPVSGGATVASCSVSDKHL